MPFPTGASTITVTGTFPVPVAGTARKGRIAFTPSARLVDDTQKAIYSGGGSITLDNAGHFSVLLLCTDDTDVQPTGWRWRVDEQPAGGPRATYWIDLPATLGATVDLSELAAVDAPDGGSSGGSGGAPTGPAGGALTGTYPNPQLSTATIASFDPAGSASAAQTAAATDATTKANAAQTAATSAAAADATAKVTAHTTATDPHGDRATATAALAAHEADTTSVHGIADTATLETQTGAQTKATAAQTAATTAAATDATNKVSTHAGATDPHGDRTYADNKFATQLDLTALNGTVNTLSTTVTAIDGYLNDALTRLQAIEQGTAFLAGGHYTGPVELVDSATPGANPAAGVYVFSQGGVLKTLSPSGEVVSLLPASGSQIRTASVRITDDNLSGLPAAAAWAVVLTSAGTQLKCSIAADVGDRIRVIGRDMRKGAHFLDWVILTGAGAIDEYATTGTSTPPAEGDPALYPSLSFGYEPGPPMFVVGAEHIDGSGNITVALAHQGASTGNANIVYAHTTYPWRLRLENIGPEPA